jgi:hypothetical protein
LLAIPVASIFRRGGLTSAKKLTSFHSQRNAFIGSTPAARSAGATQAASATIASSPTTPLSIHALSAVSAAPVTLSPSPVGRRCVSEIIGSMTISEAAALLPEPDRTYLGRWGETFGIPLSEFHIGHIRTYQIDRAREVAASIVDRGVETLIALLRELHLAGEIGQYYKGLVGPNELTAEEIEAYHRELAITLSACCRRLVLVTARHR